MPSDLTTVPCMHCIYIHQDWTWADATIRTVVKDWQQDGLFIDAEFRMCHACMPKRRLPVEPWAGLKAYYRSRGIK